MKNQNALQKLNLRSQFNFHTHLSRFTTVTLKYMKIFAACLFESEWKNHFLIKPAITHKPQYSVSFNVNYDAKINWNIHSGVPGLELYIIWLVRSGYGK